jgi:hypothetical protein
MPGDLATALVKAGVCKNMEDILAIVLACDARAGKLYS